DRLTRSVRDLGFLLEEFKKYSVDLVSVSESLDGSMAVGRLLIHLIGSIAQWERETAGERTSDALAYKRLAGRAYGPTPFGYLRSGDLLVRNGSQQRILGIMRGMRTIGESYQKIADRLNDLKVKPSRGKKWYGSSVRAVLESRMQGEVA